MRFASTLLAASLLLAPRAADACSAPPPMHRVVPANGATIPANAPALVFLGYADPTGVVKLDTVAGAAIELGFSSESGAWLLQPKAPLVEGTAYRVTFPRAPGDTTETTQSFSAGPTAKLPTSFGSIAVGPSMRRTLLVGDASGPCASQIDAAVVDVSIVLAKDLEPWLPLARIDARIDGEPWASRGYGGGVTAPPPAPSAPYSARSPALVYAKCAATSSGVDPGVAPGKHTLEVTAHVAGALSDPPKVMVDVELDCSAAPGDPKADTGAPIDGDVPSAKVDDDGGGCGVAKHHLATHAPLGIALAFVAIGAARRARRLSR